MISASYPEWDDLFGQYVQFPGSTISVLSYTGRPPRAQARERDDPQYNAKCRKVSNREALLLNAFDQAWFRLQKKSVDKLVAWVFDALNEHAEHPYRVNVLVSVLDHTIAQKITSMKQIIDTWAVVFTPHRQHIWREMNALLVKRVHLCQVHELTVILRYVTGQLSRAGDEIAQQELHKYSQSLVQAHAHAQAYSYANHNAQAPTHASVLNGTHKKKNFSIDTSIHAVSDRLDTDARQRSGSLGLVRVHTDTPQPSSKVDNARNQGNASTRAVSPAFAPSGSTAGKLVNCNVAVTQAIPLIRKIMHSSALVPQYVVFHEAFKIRNKQHWRVRQHVDRLLFQFQSLANMLRPIGWYHPAVRPVVCLTTNMAGWRVFGPDSCLFPMVGKLLNMASEMMDSKESEVMTQFLSDVLMQYTSTIGLREYLRGMDHFKIKTDSFFQTALAEMVISVLRIEHSQKSARLRNAGSAENVVNNDQAVEDVARGVDKYTAVDVDTEWHLLASHFFALLRVDEVDLEMVIRTVHTKIRAIWGDEFRSNRVVWLIHQCAFSEELKKKFKDSYTRAIEPALSVNKTAGQALAPKSSLYDLLFSLYDWEATNANTLEGDKWNIQDLSIEFLLRRLFPSESAAALNDHQDLARQLLHPRALVKQLNELKKLTATRITSGEAMTDDDFKRIAVFTFGTDTGGPVNMLWTYISTQGRGQLRASNGSVVDYCGMRTPYSVAQISRLSLYACVRFSKKFSDHLLREQQEAVLSPGAIATYINLHYVIGAACMPVAQAQSETGIVINLLINLLPRALGGGGGVAGKGQQIDKWAVIGVCIVLETITYRLLKFFLPDPGVVHRLFSMLTKILGQTSSYKMYQLAETCLLKLSLSCKRHHLLHFLSHLDTSSKANESMMQLPVCVRRSVVLMYSRMVSFPSTMLCEQGPLNATVRDCCPVTFGADKKGSNAANPTVSNPQTSATAGNAASTNLPTKVDTDIKLSRTVSVLSVLPGGTTAPGSVVGENADNKQEDKFVPPQVKIPPSSTLVGSMVHPSPLSATGLTPRQFSGSAIAATTPRRSGQSPFRLDAEGLGKYILPSVGLLYAAGTVKAFPRPVREYYIAQGKTGAVPTTEATIPEVSVKRLEEEVKAPINGSLITTNVDDPKPVVNYYQTLAMRPLFLCMVWAMKIKIRSKHLPIRIRLGIVKSVLTSYSAQEMVTFTHTLVDYIITDESGKVKSVSPSPFTAGESAQLKLVAEALSEMVWQRQMVRFEHVLDALLCDRNGGLDNDRTTPKQPTPTTSIVSGVRSRVALEITSLLLGEASEINKRITYYLESVNAARQAHISTQSRTSAANAEVYTQPPAHAHAQLQLTYLTAYPESAHFDYCVEENPTDTPSLGTHTIVPQYYDNAVVRFVPTFEVVLGKLLEHNQSASAETLLVRFAPLYSVHERALSSVYELLHYYQLSEGLTARVREAMVNALVQFTDMGENGPDRGRTGDKFSAAFLEMLKTPMDDAQVANEAAVKSVMPLDAHVNTPHMPGNKAMIGSTSLGAYMENCLDDITAVVENTYHTPSEGTQRYRDIHAYTTDFNSHKLNRIETWCVELMCLRHLLPENVADAILTALVRPRSGKGVMNVMGRINSTALLLVALPCVFRERFLSVLAECILGNEWLQGSLQTAVNDSEDYADELNDLPRECSYESDNADSPWSHPNRWEGQMAVPMIYLSLIHAIFRHGPNHWPSTMTLFFNALIDEDNLTSSLPRFGITEPRQLLYLCHLIGPTVGSMSSVPSSVKWASHTNEYQEHYSLGLLFMQLMRAFVQVNNAVVARHGTYVLPCTATSRVINFLYYIKYHYAFESFVWDDAQRMIQLFDPPLRLQLRFLQRSSP